MSSAVPDPKTKDPGFEMKPEKVEKTGGQIGGRGGDFITLSDRAKVIDMPPFTFGAVGGGINVAHRGTVDRTAQALADGKEVVESWKKALKDVADHVDQAHKASKLDKGPGGPEIKPPGGPGGIKPPGGPGIDTGGLDKMGGPGDGMKIPKDLGDMGKKPPLDGLDPNDIKDPGKDLEDIKQPDKPNVPDIPKYPEQPPPPDIKPPPGLDNAGNPPGLDTSGLDKKLQDAKTDLAGVDPKVPGAPDLDNLANRALPDARLPGGPTTGNGLTTGDGTGLGTGLGRGGAGAGSGVNGLGGAGGMGSIAKALNGGGMPMMPMAPMGGAGAGGEGDKDRERTTYLAEDEGVWGGDEDIAPPVLGKE
ncbi:hypothetical protein ACIBEJ_16255 [Nonomuraea sp. NPDC050790]|uniref:hypothetical protein n=1 Tax=Nonomuraea sp. NPDC050790 TaxID=3364371 RepID=UPI00379116C1